MKAKKYELEINVYLPKISSVVQTKDTKKFDGKKKVKIVSCRNFRQYFIVYEINSISHVRCTRKKRLFFHDYDLHIAAT